MKGMQRLPCTDSHRRAQIVRDPYSRPTCTSANSSPGASMLRIIETSTAPMVLPPA